LNDTMPSLPSGNVTLLFSDIEGSTALLSRLGAAYGDALDAQREVLRRTWNAHDGIELGTEGDSFYVVFGRATDAVTAAAQGQRDLASYEWPQGESVRVRMGMHTGAPTLRGDAYVGMDVHLAARIAASAHGGQVVLSSTTAALTDGQLPPATSLLDLGAHRLKDIGTAQHLHELAIDGLPAQFPPLKTLGSTSRLPEPATALVGREAELDELFSLLSSPDVRLVTLTGPGGSGKTRLAVALAHRLSAAETGGVYFVALAEDTTAAGAWTTLGEAIGLSPEQRTAASVLAEVTGRRLLLVLDNLEQLVGADEVAGRLLDASADAMLVATSRRPLHVHGEHEHPVPPLALPPSDLLAHVEASTAVELFAEQARRVRPDFAVTADNATDVAAICRRLDGLPLALELAGARAKLLSPSALLARLDTSLDISATGAQGPSRQRTLRSTIAWSYELLSPELQRFFRMLGVFSGGAGLDAIAAVVATEVGRADPLDLVAGLVDASLANVSEGDDGEPRVDLMVTIRAYARDLLVEHDELDTVSERHALHYLSVAESAGPLLHTSQSLPARARFDKEDGNLRVALDWTLPPDDAEPTGERSQLGLRVCTAVAEYWGASGYFWPEAGVWLERAVERTREHGDRLTWATCLFHRAAQSTIAGDFDSALDDATVSVDVLRGCADSYRLGVAANLLAMIMSFRGDVDAASELYTESLALARQSGDKVHLHMALSDMALFVESRDRDHEASLALKREALEVALELGTPTSEVMDNENIACTLRLMGRADEANDVIRGIVSDAIRINMQANLVYLAEDYGAILAEVGHSRLAASLLGVADATRERAHLPRPPLQWTEIEAAMAQARAASSADEWDEAYNVGKATPIDIVISLAYAASGPPSESSDAPDP
jgi:predicted ATPase/class 3 adenylate cyclase